MDFIPSQYNFYFEHNGKNFLYNTLSTALVELDKETYACLKNNNLDMLKSEYVNPLREMHYLTEKNKDESEEFFYFYDSVRYARSSSVFSITLIPSYNCNLACPYCMQGQEKSSAKMDDASLKAVLIFMEDYLQNHKNVTKLIICLFGGEPMLNKSLLYEFCDKSLLSKMFIQREAMPETSRSQQAEVLEFFPASTGTNQFL